MIKFTNVFLQDSFVSAVEGTLGTFKSEPLMFKCDMSFQIICTENNFGALMAYMISPYVVASL